MIGFGQRRCIGIYEAAIFIETINQIGLGDAHGLGEVDIHPRIQVERALGDDSEEANLGAQVRFINRVNCRGGIGRYANLHFIDIERELIVIASE